MMQPLPPPNVQTAELLEALREAIAALRGEVKLQTVEELLEMI